MLYLKVWVPMTHLTIPCPLHAMTGWYCPGCGITRAVLSVLNLDFVQAFRFNPLVFALIPMYAVYFVAYKKHMLPLSKGIMTLMLIITLMFGILRNFPAFHILAPTALP